MQRGKKNTLTIRVPEDLKARIEKYSVMQGVSINQFALYAFTKELGELEMNQYFTRILSERNKQEILTSFDAVMRNVPKAKVPDWDQNR